jgi:hypothetical protein
MPEPENTGMTTPVTHPPRLHRPPPETPAISPDATDADADHGDGECRANNWQAPRIRLRYGLQERAPHAPAPKKIEYSDWARSKATAPFSIPARAASLRKSCTPRVRAYGVTVGIGDGPFQISQPEPLRGLCQVTIVTVLPWMFRSPSSAPCGIMNLSARTESASSPAASNSGG